MSLATVLANRALDASMLWSTFVYRGPMLRAFRRPGAVQHALLLRILRRNAETAFGRRHDFASIASFDDFAAKVPVQSFDSLEALIEQQMAGDRALTAAPPVYYARTSGTTGPGKLIPMTGSGLHQMKLAQKLLATSIWRDTSFFEGSILGMASPAVEGRLENGVAYGASSGSAYRSLPRVLARKFATPARAFEIEDLAAKYRLYALAALSRGDVTGIAAANPSSILKVSELIAAEAATLVDALETGATARFGPEGGAVAADIIAAADRARVRDLLRALDRAGHLDVDVVWPRLAAIATWTGGSCGIALEKLRRQLPERVRIVEYGYGASEFMGAANLDAARNLCMPLLTEHVYEFVRRDEWEAGQSNFLRIEELAPGADYYVFATTQSGLYRYDINDIVRAEPGIGACPALRFLQKGRGVTNITGEKLSEHQVVAAMSETLAALDLAAAGYIALADEDASRYALHFECPDAGAPGELAAAIDGALRSLNSEYDDKRASGRLRPLIAVPLRVGAMETIRARSVAMGARESQYKPVVLAYAREWSDRLASLGPDGAP